ncbi:MAG TPA: maleylpyruvate isomerase N-terminal domain-containing protein, partial [Acidimicrobiales bacterium]|nr:maleylpyruvate isomerase N-terminal domain-containing protein [Acidimicrobiales bacterium]
VHDLVGHVLAGEVLTRRLLDGASRDEALDALPTFDLDGAMAGHAAIFAATEEGFAAPGALERIVHHPRGDLPAGQVLGFRIGDLTVHRWDLARAIGADEGLHPTLVEAVWTDLQPVAPVIATIGVFGEGPSGDVAEDAELQRRLLDLTGRRP